MSALEVGTRVELLSCSDPYTDLTPGARGRVRFVDSLGTIHVDWDGGGKLGLVPDEDRWRVVGPPPPRHGGGPWDNPVGRPPVERRAAVAFLERTLRHGAIRATEVRRRARAEGITMHTLRRAADDLEVVRNPPKGGRTCTWRLP